MERDKEIIEQNQNRNIFIGRKRKTSDKIIENIKISSIKEKKESEYEKTVKIFKILSELNWEDDKLDKLYRQKIHPSKNFNLFYLVQNLNSNSFWFHVMSNYFPIDLEIDRSDLIQNFDSKLEILNLSQNLENLRNDKFEKKLLLNDFKSLIENFENNFNNEDDMEIIIENSDLEEEITIDDLIDNTNKKLEKISQKNSQIFDKLKYKILNEEIKFYKNEKLINTEREILLDLEITHKDKEKYFHYLNIKHENLKRSILESENNFSEIMCKICNDGDYEENDFIIYCKKCEISVHQSCYGIEEIPLDEWICEVCKNFENSLLVECILCPIKGGAMKKCEININSQFYKNVTKMKKENNNFNNHIILHKPVSPSNSEANTAVTQNDLININLNNNKNKINFAWIHLSCALWNSEIQFTNFTTKEQITNVDSIKLHKFKELCKICNLKNFGPTLKCGHPHCNFRSHVECARFNNYRLEFYNEKGIYKYEIFCNDHRPNKTLKLLQNRQNNKVEEILKFVKVLEKINLFYDKEYNINLLEGKKEITTKISGRKRIRTKNNKNKNTKNDIKNKNNLDKITLKNITKLAPKLSQKQETILIKKFKLMCKLFSNPDTIVLKRINKHFQCDINSFKNKIRWNDITSNNYFPWDMIQFGNYKTEQIKKLFFQIIKDEDTYNRRILKRTAKHKDKVYFKNQENFDENLSEFNFNKDNSLLNLDSNTNEKSFYCFCNKEDDGKTMIGCEKGSKCKGANGGWYHHRCLEELKNKTENEISNSNFRFICKACKNKKR